MDGAQTKLEFSERQVSWPLTFSSTVPAKRVTVSSASDWAIKSCPWWLNAAGEGDQLFLRPRNCGFFSGNIVIERGAESASIRVSSWILPALKTAVLGLGAGGLVGLYPIWIFAGIMGLLLLITLPLLSHPVTMLAAVVPILIGAILVAAPFLPFLLGFVWGLFLRSGRAWVRTMIGVWLGAIVALLTYAFVHSHYGVASPTVSRALAEISAISLAWIGTTAVFIAGFRMLLPAAASVAIGAAIVVTALEGYATLAFQKADEKPSVFARVAARPSDVVAPGTFELADAGLTGARAVGRAARAGLCVQLVFAVSFSLLMILMFPIPVPAHGIGDDS